MVASRTPGTRPPRVASWRGRLVLGAAATFVSLFVGECGLRAYERYEQRHRGEDDSTWRDRVRHMNRTIYRRSSDPRLVYEPVPSTWVPMPYGPAGFNDGSMRDDREHAIARDPAHPRVAMLGDSLVWSEEVSIEDSLPRRVEEALADTHAEVLNFGVTGYDTAQESAWFEQHVRAYRPDVVVVVFCLNDVMIMSGPFNRFGTPEEAQRKDAQDVLLERLAPVRAETLDDLAARDLSASWFHLFTRTRWAFRRAWFDRSSTYRDEYTVLYAHPPHREQLRAAIRSLADGIQQSGATAWFVISPVLRHFRRYHWRDIHAWVANEARTAGFQVADPLPAWSGVESAEQLRLPGDSLHYGPSGQRVFARFIAQSIRRDVSDALASRTNRRE